jgi:ligand-binding SRPBCC domain-containing protein
MYELNFTQIIRRPRPEVFAFFSDIENLERITPPWLHFKILTSLPFEIEAGSIIDYRLKLSGMPFHWQTKIDIGITCIVSPTLRGERWWKITFNIASGVVR